MAWAGACGATEAEMAAVLHLDLGQERAHAAFARLAHELDEIGAARGVELHHVGSLWPQHGHPLQAPFVNLLSSTYGASVTPVDYGRPEDVRRLINDWVEDHTGHRIQGLLAPGELSRATVLTLVDAISFRGRWASRFDPRQTRPATFTRPDHSVVEVPMMHQSGVFPYRQGDGFEVLELPHQGGRLAMVVVLPRDVEALASVEERLHDRGLETMLEGLAETSVEVALPRFELSWASHDLVPALASLGMDRAFRPGHADFSGIDGSRELFIDLVLHRAELVVDEAGSEVVAGTAVTVAKGPRPPAFRADRPFLVAVRDRITGCLLLLGRVTDPSR
jgi:serpin B